MPQPPPPTSSPDAVIVGGGHNGLVAANLLADAGWDVLVLEATADLGGAVRSGELTAPGFLSDLFSAFYPLAAASPVIRGLELSSFGLEWTHSAKVLAHLFPDGRAAVLSRDADETADSVDAFAAGDGKAWLRVVDEWTEIHEPLLDTLFSPFPPVRSGLRLARRLGMADAARFARLAALPARRFGEENFAGEGARMLIAGSAGHSDIPIDSAGSAVFGWLLTMAGQTFGFPVPRGGAAALPTALHARLEQRGGAVRTNAPVTRILLSGGRASGVVLQSGERIAARRAVLADVNAIALYRDLIGYDRLPPRFVADLAKFQWDLPTVKIDWALREPIPWPVSPVRGAGTVHLGVDMDGMTQYAAELAQGRVPERPFVLLGQLTTADHTRSPKGTESLWGYTHIPRRCAESEDAVEVAVRRVEDAVERHAPEFRELVLARHVMSPTALASANPNLRHGAINGGTAELHQEAMFRPTVGLGGAHTPVEGLFLASSSAHPGGGVHGGPGSNAAQAALKATGPRGYLDRRVVRAVLSRLYR